MDEIIQHGIEKFTEKYDTWRIKNQVNEAIDRMLRDEEWPFTSVSREYLLATAVPFIENTQNIEKEKERGLTTPPEILIDRIEYTAIDFLRCVQKMHLEAMTKEAMAHAPDKNIPLEKMMQTREKAATFLVSWGGDLLQKQNNKAVQLMADEYAKIGKTPICISDENDKHYTRKIALSMTQTAIDEHETSFSKAYSRAASILKDGMPAETAIGKVMDKILPQREQRRESNESAVIDLLRAETKIDHIQNFVIFSLEKQAANELTTALLEECVRMRETGEPGVSANRRYREETLKAVEQIKNDIQAMRLREASLMKDMTLDITKGDDGIYSITVSRGDGIKRQLKLEHEESEFTRTVEHKRKEETRTIKLTSVTEKVMEETKSYRMIFHGEKEEGLTPTHNKEKENEKKGYEKSQSFGESSFTTTRKIQGNGTRTARMELKFHAAHFAGRKIRTNNIGPKVEKKTIIGGDVEFLGASASIKAPDKEHIGTPKLSAEAHAVEGNANLGDILKLKTSLGVSASAGVQLSAEDIIKSATSIMYDELMNGSAANLTRIVDEVAEIVSKIPPSANVDWGSITISSSDFDLFKAQVDSMERGVDTLDVSVSSPIVDNVMEDVQKAQQLDQKLWDYYMTPNSTPTKAVDDIERSTSHSPVAIDEYDLIR